MSARGIEIVRAVSEKRKNDLRLKQRQIKTRAILTQRQQQQKWLVGIMIGLFVLGIGLVFWFSSKTPTNSAPLVEQTAVGLTLGEANAPVRVEEFFDFQCSHCQTFAQQQEAAFIKQYVQSGQVYLVAIPFSFLGEESIKAAEAALCADEQGGFWQYRQDLFAKLGQYSEKTYLSVASNLGLEMTTFQKCLTDRSYRTKVAAALAYGRQKGIDGTPLFLVNGQRVDSTQLTATIDALLAK